MTRTSRFRPRIALQTRISLLVIYLDQLVPYASSVDLPSAKSALTGQRSASIRSGARARQQHHGVARRNGKLSSVLRSTSRAAQPGLELRIDRLATSRLGRHGGRERGVRYPKKPGVKRFADPVVMESSARAATAAAAAAGTRQRPSEGLGVEWRRRPPYR